MAHYTHHFILLFLATISFFSFTFSKDAPSINVLSFGAKPNGNFDSTTSFVKAWSSACKSKEPATFYVPKGFFLLKQVIIEGPCSSNIKFRIAGTIVAPSDYSSLGNRSLAILLYFIYKKKQNSGVKISKVSYEHIRGTSACPQAINFDCSKSNPCEGIKLQDIDLVYDNGSSTSTCKNADGITRGEVIPKSCL
ncbi:Polygalacturonase [Glycine max]|nr:Polygalacturonase [Glycine max]